MVVAEVVTTAWVLKKMVFQVVQVVVRLITEMDQEVQEV
jgi:hypothetical protein